MIKKFRLFLFLILLINFISIPSVFAARWKMIDNGTGGMMGGMSLMSRWVSGETLPIDMATPKPAENEVSLNAGKVIYETRCPFCHGLKGDGKGEEAQNLKTKPRDFTRGVYKFRSTPSGDLPTDDDIFKTISRGLHGTSMLPWFGLTTSQKWSVVYYIKTFSDVFEDDEKPEIVITPLPDKPGKDYIEQGKVVYQKAKCWECHGNEGYGDGEKANELKDDWGQPIFPRNFHQDILKRGLEIEDIYLTIATGLSGTPMPSFSDSLTQDEIMSLAYFIQSMAPQRSAGTGMMMEQDIHPEERIGMMIDHVMMPSMQEDSMASGKVPRGRLGIMIQVITPELAEAFNLPENKGALVADVLKESPAERSGILRGDVIVEFNGQPVIIMEDLPKMVARTEPGSDVQLVVIRNGKRKVIETTIDQPEGSEVTEPKKIDKIGLQVQNITSELMQSLNLDSMNGVLVADVIIGSPAGAAGIQRGDVIEEVNKEKVNNLNDFQENIDKGAAEDSMLFLVKRSGSTQYIALKLK